MVIDLEAITSRYAEWLSERNWKLRQQRTSLLSTLPKVAPEDFDVDSILERLGDANVDRPTVYRLLNELAECEIIVRIPEGKPFSFSFNERYRK